MNYKALILDVDGTLISYKKNAVPSQKVQSSIKKASKYVKISIATGRSYAFAEPVLKTLDFDSGIAIVNNGAQVVDIATKKRYFDQPINTDDLIKAISVFFIKNIPFYFNEGFEDCLYNPSYEPNQVYTIYTHDIFNQTQVDILLHELSFHKTLSIQQTTHKNGNLYGLLITHSRATKQRGILELANIFKINPSSIIGVGDGYNDFPLLMACGLKVAMGNANSDLKAIADYIAPSVDEDGVADVIEKYILRSDEI